MPTTQNLGVVKAIHISTSAPTNTQMLWYDTTANVHKYYNVVTGIWTPLTSGGGAVTSVNGQIGVVVLDADDISDVGTTNQWYTQARFDASLALKTTDDLAEGATNLYYTTARFNTDFALKDTDDLSEGSTNLYFTNARAIAAISGVAPIQVNPGTGAISMTQASAGSDGWLSSTDWQTFNNKLSAPSGTLNRIVKFTPSGSAFGDSTILEDGGAINFGGSLSLTDNHLSFQGTTAGNTKINALNIEFQTTVSNSHGIKVLNSTTNQNVYGIKSTYGNATDQGAALWGASGGVGGTIPTWNDSTISNAGVVSTIRNNQGYVSGIRAIVDNDGLDPATDFAYGAWFTVTSANGTKYPLRLEDGNDNTGKILKVIDTDGHVDFADVTAVQAGSPASQNYLTKWSTVSNTIINSSIQDDGAVIAINSTLDTDKSVNLMSNEIYGLFVDHMAPSSSVNPGVGNIGTMPSGVYVNDTLDNSATQMKAGYSALMSGGASDPQGGPFTSDDRYVGYYSLVSSSAGTVYTPTFDPYTEDLIDGTSRVAIGAMFSAIANDRDNYALRLRADNDNVDENIGLYIKTRNAVGNQVPIIIDSPNKGANKVLTSDANGRADWQTVPVATGVVTVAANGSYLANYITKWDAAANDIIYSQIQDDGNTLAIGTAALNPDRYIAITSSTKEDILHISQTKATGNPAAIYAEAVGAVTGTNNAAHFVAINGGTNYPLRLENGNGASNNGKYLKVIDNDGNIDFAVAGTGTVTDQSGGQTLHYLTKWTATDEIGDSSISQSATTPSIGIGTAADNASSLAIGSTTSTTTSLSITKAGGGFTAQTRGVYVLNTNSNTQENIGIHTQAMTSSDVNVGLHAVAGTTSPNPLPANGKYQAISAYAQAETTADQATGIYVSVAGASNVNNYGVIIQAANSGTGGQYALKLVDGSQGLNKVLTSDANGNASWQTAASANNFYTADGTVGAGRVATITDFPKFSGTQTNPIGLEIENTQGGGGAHSTMGAQLKITSVGDSATVSYYNGGGGGTSAPALVLDSPSRVIYRAANDDGHQFDLNSGRFYFDNDSASAYPIFTSEVAGGGSNYTEYRLAKTGTNYNYINSPSSISTKLFAFGKVVGGTPTEAMRMDGSYQLGINSDGMTIGAQLHVKSDGNEAGSFIGLFDNADGHSVLKIEDNGVVTVGTHTSYAQAVGIRLQASYGATGTDQFVTIGDTNGNDWLTKKQGPTGTVLDTLWLGRNIGYSGTNNIIVNGPGTFGEPSDTQTDITGTSLWVWAGANAYGQYITGATQDNSTYALSVRNWNGSSTVPAHDTYFELRNDKRLIYNDGNVSAGRVLTCDGSGVATWQDVSSTDTNIANSNLVWTGDTTQNIASHTLTFATANNSRRFIIDDQYDGIFIGLIPSGTGAAVNITDNTAIFMNSPSAGYGNSKFQPYQPGQLHHRWVASGGATLALDASDGDVHVMGSNARLGINLGTTSPTAHLEVKQTIENEEIIKASNASGTNNFTIDADGIWTGGTSNSWVFYRGGPTTGTNFSSDLRWNNFYFGGNGAFNQTRFYIRSGDGTTEAAGVSTIYLQDAVISQNQSTDQLDIESGNVYINSPFTYTSGKFGITIDPRTLLDATYSTDGTLTTFDQRTDPWVFQSNYTALVNMNIISNNEQGAAIRFKNQAGSEKGSIVVSNANGDMTLNAANDVVVATGTKLGIGLSAPIEALDVEANIRAEGQIYSRVPTDVTISGNAATVDWNNGNSVTLDLAAATGNVTVTFTNVKRGATYFLVIKQKASSPVNITTYSWSGGSIKFPGGTAPTISTGASAIDTVVLYGDSNGDLLANFAQDYS